MKNYLITQLILKLLFYNFFVIRSVDKSLARPGSKQTTATKLGIYSTYSPRSSIHFLTCCFNFCKPRKKIWSLSVQPGLCGSNDLRVGRKMANFQFFFLVQGTGDSPTGPDSENRVGDQDIRSPLLGCKCPVSRGIVAQEQDFPRRFSFKVSFNYTGRDE